MANLEPVPSTGIMWRAYAFAPAAAPLSFVALLSVVGVVLPVAAIAAVTVVCYSVAGLIGMPIAFFLRSRHALNGYTIHGAAFCWGLLSSVVCAAASISVAAAIGGTWDSVPLVVAAFAAIIVPPVVLSGTGFWLLLRKMAADELWHNTSDGSQPASPKTADNYPIHQSGGGAFFGRSMSFAAAR